MNEQLFIETQLESWDQIFDLQCRCLNAFVYRGQPDHNFPVLSSLERAIKMMHPYLKDQSVFALTERQMLKEFKWKFPLYGTNAPEATDHLEWLAIMQHFGAPTRLIDVTRSLFIAAYFATANFNNRESAIWGFNSGKITEPAFMNYRSEFETNSCAMDELFAYSKKLGNHYIDKNLDKDLPMSLLLVDPQRANERILNQQALFITQSDIKKPFEDHLQANIKQNQTWKFTKLIDYSTRHSFSDIFALKIKIPNRISIDVRRSLKSMNISSESLFPGMEGMAKSLLKQILDDRH